MKTYVANLYSTYQALRSALDALEEVERKRNESPQLKLFPRPENYACALHWFLLDLVILTTGMNDWGAPETFSAYKALVVRFNEALQVSYAGHPPFFFYDNWSPGGGGYEFTIDARRLLKAEEYRKALEVLLKVLIQEVGEDGLGPFYLLPARRIASRYYHESVEKVWLDVFEEFECELPQHLVEGINHLRQQRR